MPALSIFEILGPVMIGPSSSHTAGAVRIGYLAGKLAGKQLKKITLKFRKALLKTYKGHATDLGLVSGLMGHREDDDAVRTSLSEAREKGIAVSVEEIPEPGHPNEMRCEIECVDGSHHVISGISLGGGSIVISHVDGVTFSIDGFSAGYFLRLHHRSLVPKVLEFFRDNGFWIDQAQSGTSESSGEALLFIPGDHQVDLRHIPGGELVRKGSRQNPGSSCGQSPQGIESMCISWIPSIYPGRKNPKERKPLFKSAKDILRLERESGMSLPAIVIEYEKEFTGLLEEEIKDQMRYILKVMKSAVRRGLEEPLELLGGFVPGNNGKSLWERAVKGQTLTGQVFTKSLAMALSVMEVNASMGKVVAAPTAGSCGVLPGVLLAVEERIHPEFSVLEQVPQPRDSSSQSAANPWSPELSDERLIDALLAASGTGIIIGNVASFSGAVGGCQGEVGAASAISAAAATFLGGGTAEASFEASAMAIKNLLGLVCDPVAGPVEIPCIKRNAGGVSIALSSAEMALSGIKSAVPFDEVILALKNVQDLLPEDLRDNTLGGLGSTPTAARIKEAWDKKCSTCRFC